MRWLLALALTFCAAAAMAERRVALVIGNSAYDHAPALKNPVRDASAVALKLQGLGFEVLTGLDQTADQMRATVRAFSVALDSADLAVFYFAGHGIQVAGSNYLIPVDAEILREADVDFSTLRLDLILAQMERAAATRIVLLDACRNNPFEGQLTRSMGQTRAVTTLGSGLAPVRSEGGAFIGFATDPGAVAFDGTGDHSPFSAALLSHLETPGLEINAMMTRVRADVYSATDRRQRPWTTSSLLSEVYLAPNQATEDLARDPRLADLAAWDAIAGSDQARDFQQYLNEHPGGLFRDIAAARIAALAPPETDLPPVISDNAPLLPLADDTPSGQASLPAPETAAPAATARAPSLSPGTLPADTQLAVAAPAALLPPGLRPSPRPTRQRATPDPDPGDCAACPATVSLPGGEVLTGSDRQGEGPVTRQVLAPFAIAATEITVRDIRRYEAATGRRIPRGCHVWTQDGKMRQRAAAYWGAPGFPVTDDTPAACLNWDDAEAYADWLNTQDARGGWRLPSEAEFEYGRTRQP